MKQDEGEDECKPNLRVEYYQQNPAELLQALDVLLRSERGLITIITVRSEGKTKASVEFEGDTGRFICSAPTLRTALALIVGTATKPKK